jgi:hypothetical protein
MLLLLPACLNFHPINILHTVYKFLYSLRGEKGAEEDEAAAAIGL